MITIMLFSNGPTENYEAKEYIITSRRFFEESDAHCTFRLELRAAREDKSTYMTITLDNRWVAVTLHAAEDTMLLISEMLIRVESDVVSLYFQGTEEQLERLRGMLKTLQNEYRHYQP
jgi:hypothetical protein